MQYWVLGATGYIGSHLYQRLRHDGCNVIGTSRNIYDDRMIYYNIENGDIDSLMKKADINEKKIAIICIAESNIDRCYENYSKAYDINVVNAKKLIYGLAEDDFHVIYFSSDSVFDGVTGDYTEESQTNPLNKYGLMKAEMEQYILQNIPEACVLRIPKVVSGQKKKQNVFTEWLDQIETGSIRCIKGNRISFVCVEDIYQVCLIAAEKKMHGLYNIAGDKSYSRAELADMFYKKLGVLNVDIQECSVEEFNFKDSRPLNTSMSNIKFRSETGYQFMDMDDVMQKFINNIGKQL